MTAVWFIKSRGRDESHDYVWRSLGRQDKDAAQRLIVDGYRGASCYTFLDDEKPGLIFFSNEQRQLVLLVTGVIADSKPVDFRSRDIRITLLGVADGGDLSSCRELAAVAAASLRDELGARMPISYGSGKGDAGFEVRAAQWLSYVDEATKSRLGATSSPKPSAWQFPDTDEYRSDVAADVAALCERPKLFEALDGRIITLRTSILGKETIGKHWPWRTLSRLVEAPDELAHPAGGLAEAVGGVIIWAGKKGLDAITKYPFFSLAGVAVVGGAVLWSVLVSGPTVPPVIAKPPVTYVTKIVTKPALLTWGDKGPVTTMPAGAGWGGGGKPEASAGKDFSLALTPAGKVLAWGANNVGQLGRSGGNSAAPVTVGISSPVTAISAGCEHSLALTSQGKVLAWGDNRDGQLGVPSGKKSFSATPVPVRIPGAVKQISAGCDDSLALTRSGEVFAWGSTAHGELGSRPSRLDTKPAVMNLPGVTVTQVSAGCGFSLALTSHGAVYAWGEDDLNQLGRAEFREHSALPVLVPGTGGARSVTQIAAGCDHSLARTSHGAVLAWGGDGDGQLGDTVVVTSATKPTVAGLPYRAKAAAVYAGDDVSLAKLSTGQIFAWGANNGGQLGGPSTVARNSVPEPVSLDPADFSINVVGLGPGASHGIAIGTLKQEIRVRLTKKHDRRK